MIRVIGLGGVRRFELTVTLVQAGGFRATVPAIGSGRRVRVVVAGTPGDGGRARLAPAIGPGG